MAMRVGIFNGNRILYNGKKAFVAFSMLGTGDVPEHPEGPAALWY